MTSCNDYQNRMDELIDGRLGTRARHTLQEHMAGCTDCRGQYEARSRLVNSLRAMEPAQPPAELNRRLHRALDEHLQKEALPMGRKLNLGVLSAVTAGLLLVLVVGTVTLGGLGAAPGRIDPNTGLTKTDDYYGLGVAGEDMGAPAEEPEMDIDKGAEFDNTGTDGTRGESAAPQEAPSVSGGSDNVLTADRKIVYTGMIQTRTSQFDADFNAVRQFCTAAQGYIEYEAVQGLPFTQPDGAGRTAQIMLRIPKGQYDGFTASVKALGQLTYSQQNAADITAGYVDTEIRLRTLNKQLNQLEEILDKSERLEDVVTLVAEISYVTQQIESMESQLTMWDNQVAYTSVTVILNEVKEYTAIDPTDPSLGQKITDAFFGSLSAIKAGTLNFFVWVVGASPYIVAILVAAGVVTIVVVSIRRRAARRGQTPPPESTPPEQGE